MGEEQGDKIGPATQECTAGALETAGGGLVLTGCPSSLGGQSCPGASRVCPEGGSWVKEGRAGSEPRASQRQLECSGLVPSPANLHSRYFLREESVAQRWEGTASKLGAEPSPTPALPAPPTSRPGPPAAETDLLLWGHRAPQVGPARVWALLIPQMNPGHLLTTGLGIITGGVMGNTAENACASLELGEDVFSCSVKTNSL